MSDRPNILWYCTDQQRFDTIGALGNPRVRTPVVDDLVAKGVAFTHTYCQSPICTPSRSSFMSGLYPSRVHNTRNGNDTFPSWPPVITKLLRTPDTPVGWWENFIYKVRASARSHGLMMVSAIGSLATHREMTGRKDMTMRIGCVPKGAT